MDAEIVKSEIQRAKYHKECHRALYAQFMRKGDPQKAESHSLQAGTWRAIQDALERIQ